VLVTALQGTLREALDHKILLRNSTNGYLQPTIMLSLAHDIAAALLHLHSEGKSAVTWYTVTWYMQPASVILCCYTAMFTRYISHVLQCCWERPHSCLGVVHLLFLRIIAETRCLLCHHRRGAW
jgi:hypothetical protein